MITGVFTLGFMVFFTPEKIMDYFTDYHWTSQRALIQYIEKHYTISFPQSMNNVKVAEAYIGFDGSSMFIIKFHMNPEELGSFLSQFDETTDNMIPYASKVDKRGSDEYPEWFQSPIENGWIGEIDIYGVSNNRPDIYIDSSNEKECIVYMEGLYRM